MTNVIVPVILINNQLK